MNCWQGLAAVVVVAVFLKYPAVSAMEKIPTLGVCWGRVAHQPMAPDRVVSMLQANGVSRVKLFNADPDALAALANSDMEVMVMVKNGFLEGMAGDPANADAWLYNNVLAAMPSGVNITLISVGNEPFIDPTPRDFDLFVVPALNNLYDALVRVGLADKIKLTVSVNSNVLQNTYPPSKASWITVWANQLQQIAQFIDRTGSVFSINIYPFYALSGGKNAPDQRLIFFDGGASFPDNGLTYTNILDASIDSLVAALAKAGYPNMEIIIGEAGWPSDGSQFATLSNAQSFNNGLFRHLLSGQGTPKRPGRNFTFYLFSLFDEDAKSIEPGAFERRWGVYDDLGRPKYPLDPSGGLVPGAQLAATPDVRYLPKRWCIVDPNLQVRLQNSGMSDPATSAHAMLQSAVTTICGSTMVDFGGQADCTPMAAALTSPGLQCASASATLEQNVSYVLNARYQVRGHDKQACLANGIGLEVNDDPSYGQCTYQVGLDAASMVSYYDPATTFDPMVLAYLVAFIVIFANFL